MFSGSIPSPPDTKYITFLFHVPAVFGHTSNKGHEAGRRFEGLPPLLPGGVFFVVCATCAAGCFRDEEKKLSFTFADIYRGLPVRCKGGKCRCAVFWGPLNVFIKRRGAFASLHGGRIINLSAAGG